MTQEEKEIITKKLSLTEIQQILSQNNLDELIGVEETDYLEVREYPYATTSPAVNKYKSQLELAKDITSIANSGGGLLCIGAVCEKKASVNIEYIRKIKGVDEKDINMQSWMDTLAALVIPRFSPRLIKYGFAGNEKKLFWIRVEDAKKLGLFPLIIAVDQWVPEKDTTIHGKVFGYYYRDGAENILHSPEEIQRFIGEALARKTAGGRTEPDNPAIQEIRSMFDVILQQVGRRTTPLKDYDNLEKKMIEYASSRIGGSDGYFYMYAIPKSDVDIPNFWDKDEKSVYNLLKNPPYIRRMGWDLSVSYQEYPYTTGDAWEIMNGDRKLISANRYGEVFAAAAIDGFFDWRNEEYVTKDGSKKKIVNAFALTEFVDIFFHFFMVFRQLFATGLDYEIRYGFIYPPDVPLLLHRPHQLGYYSHATSGDIKKSQWSTTIRADDDRHPSYIAGDVVVELNASGFGLAGEPYAYLTKDNDGYKVDEEFYIKKSV